MAIKKHNNAYLNFNPNMQLSLVQESDIESYQRLGFCHLMVKFPSMEDIPELTKSEYRVIRILMTGRPPKDIARILKMDEASVTRIIAVIREKFDCKTTTELVLKAQAMGIGMLFPHQRR